MVAPVSRFPLAPAQPADDGVARTLHIIQNTKVMTLPRVTALPAGPFRDQIVSLESGGSISLHWYNGAAWKLVNTS